jgi:hypothetical protein
MIETLIAPRHRVMKAGTIEFGSSAIDCMVRNTYRLREPR